VIEKEKQVELYRVMYRAFRWEQTLLRLMDQNLAPASYHPGHGSEASEVGAAMALRPSDYLLYDHRGMAHIVAKGTPLVSLFGDFLANSLGTTRGLGAGIVHTADPAHGVLGQSGTLGGSQLIAAGAALSAKIRGTDQVTMCFCGDGAANRGTFHEAANAAGAWKLPIVFVIQNNGWAVSVPTEQSTGGRFVDRAKGYGFDGVRVDGLDVFAVYEAAVTAVERARSGGGPTLIETQTARFTGHYFGDPQRYRSAGERESAASRDPIAVGRQTLLDSGTCTEDELVSIEQETDTEVSAARDEALTGVVPGDSRLTEYLYV
jgi:pyruvate dehydrogenase E1 component alpha subunit